MDRLTDEKQIGCFASLKDKAEAVPGVFGTYDAFYSHAVAVTRLKAYEDAIPFDELPRAAELVRAEKEGKLHIGRCLECKEYEGLAVCSLIGDCGGTNFHCGWFAPRDEAEAALQKGAGGQ